MTATATTYLVQGADPSLRDREVQRVVDDLLAGEDRTLALEDFTIPEKRGAAEEPEPSGGTDTDGDGASVGLPAFTAITNALQSPPFMTAYRVVVVRGIGGLTADQAKWLAAWVAEPPDTARLVLVVGGGRTHPALDKACKANATVVGPATEDTAKLVADALRQAKLKLAPDALAGVVQRLGDDAGRVPELVEVLHSTYGSGVTLDLTQVEPYLGEVGTAGPFELGNALDKGDRAGALAVLHRMLTATSAKQPKPLHPMQIMATLSNHYRRMLRLDDPRIVTKEQAAAALNMKSAAGARFPLDAAKRLGTEGLSEAIRLLAQAELDLRGATGIDERTVMELLVARLASLSQRAQPAGRARR